MLGYVDLNYSPRQQPIRTLVPGQMTQIAPDNAGAADIGFSQRPDNSDNNDTDLRNIDIRLKSGSILFGRDYKRLANRAKGTGNTPEDLGESYTGPIAQAAKAHNALHFNLQGITRRIVSPDAQTQTETGYTLPLQDFAFVSDKLWNSPAGRNVAGTSMSQPSIGLPAPTASIPTAMPWNVSAPGMPY